MWITHKNKMHANNAMCFFECTCDNQTDFPSKMYTFPHCSCHGHSRAHNSLYTNLYCTVGEHTMNACKYLRESEKNCCIIIIIYVASVVWNRCECCASRYAFIFGARVLFYSVFMAARRTILKPLSFGHSNCVAVSQNVVFWQHCSTHYGTKFPTSHTCRIYIYILISAILSQMDNLVMRFWCDHSSAGGKSSWRRRKHANKITNVIEWGWKFTRVTIDTCARSAPSWYRHRASSIRVADFQIQLENYVYGF